MRSTLAFLSVLGSAAAQGVTGKISPSGSTPSGCSASFDGNFEIAVLDVTKAKRDQVFKRGATCSTDGILVASLSGGVLSDAFKRTGYIASNFQFQFDAPPQAGAIYTAGFSVCGNNSLAFGPTTTFFKCQSGDFFNLYDRSWAAQCSPVQIQVMKCGADDPPEDASQRPDGQIVGTTVRATTVVVPLSDGQPQVITTVVPVPLCQINDGQLQVKTTPCASITSVAAKPTTVPLPPVSQFSDGQIQVTTGGAQPTTPRPTTVAPGTTAAPGTASAPGVTGAPTAAPSTTLRTTGSSAANTSASRPTSSAPATTSASVNAAGSVEMSSVSALVVGILGAVWFL